MPVTKDALSAYFDTEKLLERVDYDEEFFLELVQTFLEEAPGTLDRLQTALDNQDADLVGKTAHELKGMCLNMEARTLHPLAFELEQCGKNNFNVPPQPIMDQIQANFKLIQQAVS